MGTVDTDTTHCKHTSETYTHTQLSQYNSTLILQTLHYIIVQPIDDSWSLCYCGLCFVWLLLNSLERKTQEEQGSTKEEDCSLRKKWPGYREDPTSWVRAVWITGGEGWDSQ